MAMITDRLNSRVVYKGQKRSQTATIHLVQSSKYVRRLAKLLMVGLVASIFGMIFLPWQQTSRGNGQVVAFVPQERQQSIQSPTKGVVARIGEGLVEGSQVSKGDFILEIQPFAANLAEQLDGQLSELKTKLETYAVKTEVYGENIIGFTDAKTFIVQAGTEMISAADAKLKSKQESLAAYKAKVLQAKLNYERQNSLYRKGLKPAKEVEKLKKEWDVAKADLESVHRMISSLQNELKAKGSELEAKRQVAQTKIDYARAMQQDALGSAATVRKEIRDIEIKREEMKRLTITAPRDGIIFRMPIYEQGQTIKEGDSILTLIPDSSKKAVELYVRGNDMPLIQAGQEVRLQFEGWPAVQFAGWPSVAVGTFSGMVATVDATDNGKGEFRVLVTQNPDEEQWPSDHYLRQGVRANGWVMLDNVALGYEIWRQLNGFPLVVSEKEPGAKKSKPPKLPK